MGTINENFSLVKFIIKKNMNGDITPSQFSLLINASQNEYLAFLLGEPEQYQPGRPIPRVGLGNNEVLMQKLSPLISSPTTLTVDGSGKAPYPTGYIMTNAMFDANNKKIKWVQQNALPSYLESTIDPVATNPIFLLENGNFQFYPLSLGTAKISYVQKPTAAVWGYTTDVNGRPDYDAGTSTDLVWADVDQMEIIARMLRKIGVSLQENQVSQYANEIKTQGT